MKCDNSDEMVVGNLGGGGTAREKCAQRGSVREEQMTRWENEGRGGRQKRQSSVAKAGAHVVK